MEVITVANNKGGVGKTMQCYQLACHLASKGRTHQRAAHGHRGAPPELEDERVVSNQYRPDHQIMEGRLG